MKNKVAKVVGEYEAKRSFLAHIWLGLYHRAKITSVKLVVLDYRLYFVVLKKCTVLINLVLETLLHRKMEERLLFLI